MTNKFTQGLALFFALVFSNNALAQIRPVAQPIAPIQTYPTDVQDFGKVMEDGGILDRCGFLQMVQQQERYGYDRSKTDQIINDIVKRKKQEKGKTFVTDTYVVPVVFHIIHQPGEAVGTGSNIAASQIYEQIAELNRNFNNQTGSTEAAAASANITFCPVLLAPDGTPLAEPGIDRIDRTVHGWLDMESFTVSAQTLDYIETYVKPVSYWDPSKYLNVWVADFHNSGRLGGWSSQPDLTEINGLPLGEQPQVAGIVLMTRFVGSTTSPGPDTQFNYGRIGTHEMGHFFGLLHTWGDRSDCTGSDYCDDTPPCRSPYFSSYPTCPTVAAANCPGYVRMVSNFEDYSWDLCKKTFTADQVMRMQAVLQYAPNRPRNPAATMCAPIANDAFGFVKPNLNVREDSSGICGGYVDYDVLLQPAIAASGNATVAVTVGGTATQGKDYDIIGATSFTYVAGESNAKGFKVRVYDDGFAEANETIEFHYSLTGSGLQPNAFNQKFVLVVEDDDKTSEINQLTPQKTIFSENFDALAVGTLPKDWLQGSVGGTETNKFTVNNVYGSSGFTAADGKILHITNGGAALMLAGTAAMEYTKTVLTNYAILTTPINTIGYTNLTLKFDYAARGEGAVADSLDYAVVGYALGSQFAPISLIQSLEPALTKTSITITLPQECLNKEKVHLMWGWVNNKNGLGAAPPLAVDNIRLLGDVVKVETQLHSTNKEVVTAEQVDFVDASNNIIASISNADEKIGCIIATVSIMGNGKTPLLTNAGNFERSKKVVSIQPTTPNATANYTIKLYYTTDELMGWSDPLSLKVLKVKDGQTLNGTVPSASLEIYTPTVNDLRATKGYVEYTVDAHNGFSQFMLASNDIVLPVKLLTFTATPLENSINLKWSTATETNSRGFYVERKTSASDFQKIKWVDGRGSSNVQTDYQYEDINVFKNTDYFYRLQQVDLDGKFVFSDTRKARLVGKDEAVTAQLDNGTINIFSNEDQGLGLVKLLGMDGKTIKTWGNVNLTKGKTSIAAQKLPKAVYVLAIQNKKGNLFVKVF